VKLENNTYAELHDAILASHPGDTILLPIGHYWDESLIITHSLRIMGETDDPSRCVLELSGSMILQGMKVSLKKTDKGKDFSFAKKGPNVILTGLSLTRRKILSDPNPYIKLIDSSILVRTILILRILYDCMIIVYFYLFRCFIVMYQMVGVKAQLYQPRNQV
jgi:hypothetical protein